MAFYKKLSWSEVKEIIDLNVSVWHLDGEQSDLEIDWLTMRKDLGYGYEEEQ